MKLAAAIFQQAIYTILFVWDFADAYLDNILIKTLFKQRNNKRMKRVFEKIWEYGFKLSEEIAICFCRKSSTLDKSLTKMFVNKNILVSAIKNNLYDAIILGTSKLLLNLYT